LGVAVGGGGELKLEVVAREGQPRGWGSQQGQRGPPGGREGARRAQQGVERGGRVFEFGQLHAQEGFGAADPQHRPVRRLHLIIEHFRCADVIESVDRQLAPGGPAVFVERERADDGPFRAIGEGRFGGEPAIAVGVGIGQHQALGQTLHRLDWVEGVVDRVVREDARLRQQEHMMVQRADDDLAGIGGQCRAKLKVHNLRRRTLGVECYAQRSLRIRAHPQIPQVVFRKRSRGLRQRNLLRVDLPLVARRDEPAHTF